MGLFWLFLFRFRNNRIRGISTSKRTLLHVSDLEMELEESEERNLRTTISANTTGTGGRVGFPAKNFPKELILSIPSKPHSFHSVHSAIGSRIYSEYSYSGIVPKECTLSQTCVDVSIISFLCFIHRNAVSTTIQGHLLVMNLV